MKQDTPISTSEPDARRGLASTPSAGPSTFKDAQPLTLIRARVQDRSKLLGNFLEHNLVGWRLQDGQVRFTFSKEVRWALDILTEHGNHELLRTICSEVLRKPVQISVSVEESENVEVSQNSMQLSPRERAELDPRARAVMKRFKGAWLGTRDLS